ncbi:hypothetical protein AVEN_116687-1 [Araneus ventricosus]|uniref:C2H2-type domain-containing protein n=1 Tax=Araneus ventricosus TaxID=182803 RepID=A0A4Y2MBW7_ARAVE|nr:hypothetical protein AVEN_116687-1 [Araneus ventricosus]
MIAFRCPRCSKVSISTEGHRCLHCGNEETRVSSIPENQTEARSTSTNDSDVFLHMQNKSTGTDFSVLSQAPEKCNAAKLHESDGKDKDTKTLNENRSHISSSQGEPVRPITQNIVLKEMVISPGQSACSNTFYRVDNGRPITQNSILKDIRISRGQAISTKSGASVPTKTLKHISEESYRHMSKNNLSEKKIFEHNKTTKSIQNVNIIGKMKLGCSGAFPPEKSNLDSFTKDSVDVNQLKENPKYSSCKLLRKTDTSTINNIFQDDKKIRNAFSQRSASSSQEVYREGCSKNYLNRKMPTKSVKTLQKLYLCNKCGNKFNEESAFNVHYLKHFKEKPFKCDRCNKEYLSETHLKEHYNSHMDKGPFKCEICELVFIRNCHLSRHRKKHILEPAVDASTVQQNPYKMRIQLGS